MTGYVPPHSRRADGTSSATTLSLGHDANGLAGKLGKLSGQRLPPGAAPPDTKSASKNSKRRSKKKAASAEADADGGDGVHAVPSDVSSSANGETDPDCGFCFVTGRQVCCQARKHCMCWHVIITAKCRMTDHSDMQ